jgi:chemotaxis protein methyltransferase CheR
MKLLTIDEKEFLRLTDFLKHNFGINLTAKKNLIEGRLSNYILERGYNSFSEYIEVVFNDKTDSELTNLLNKLTTNHTFFMREWKSIEFYRDIILPQISASSRDKDLRVWSAGCSSGEEPYTLAMLNIDFFSNSGVKWDTSILATDISVKSLEKAELGIYDTSAVATLLPMWRLKYFKLFDSERMQITGDVRNEVIFRSFNLMQNSFPFRRKFHTIFCRNVMIYFDAPTKVDLVNKFYDCVEPGGYLIIGQSESINRDLTKFKYIMPSIYRKE